MENKSNLPPDARPLPESAPTEEHISHFGLIIGILIVVLALVLIGLYVWSQMMARPAAPLPTPVRPTAAENNEPESTTAEARAQTLDIVSTSDELGAIEADLEATALDDFVTELNAIDAELEARP
jgi:hypothetical protein